MPSAHTPTPGARRSSSTSRSQPSPPSTASSQRSVVSLPAVVSLLLQPFPNHLPNTTVVPRGTASRTWCPSRPRGHVPRHGAPRLARRSTRSRTRSTARRGRLLRGLRDRPRARHARLPLRRQGRPRPPAHCVPRRPKHAPAPPLPAPRPPQPASTSSQRAS